ncbi:MAG: helix-turn-helix domain-containing protein [Clostridiales bacterium]|nr:helix-turn-helix domain-containing protein [Clostridiales bacterium]MBS5877274.1 helix-turn-helix domain-containing protein [Clostridiales bacterium]
MTIGDRIKSRRIALDIAQIELANSIGVSKQTLYKYENNIISNIPSNCIEEIARQLKTTPAYLMGWNENNIDDSLQENIIPFTPKYLPLVGETACGEPIYSEETRGVYIQIDKDIKADFCVKAKGDSMINARIHNSDIVFIRKQETVENGEIAVVIIKDEVTLKRVYYYKEQNTLILRPENPMYPEQVYSNEQLEQIKILGKAIAFQSFIK